MRINDGRWLGLLEHSAWMIMASCSPVRLQRWIWLAANHRSSARRWPIGR